MCDTPGDGPGFSGPHPPAHWLRGSADGGTLLGIETIEDVGHVPTISGTYDRHFAQSFAGRGSDAEFGLDVGNRRIVRWCCRRRSGRWAPRLPLFTLPTNRPHPIDLDVDFLPLDTAGL